MLMQSTEKLDFSKCQIIAIQEQDKNTNQRKIVFRLLEKRVKSTPINLPNSRSVLIDIEPMVASCSQNLRENVIDSDHYQSDNEVEPVIIRKK